MKKKTKKLKPFKPELEVIILNNHTEVVTKEVAECIWKQRNALLAIKTEVNLACLL